MSHTDCILDAITEATGDTTVADTVYSRRAVLSKSALGVAALALTGMPLGLATLTEQAYAQTSGTDATAVLVQALKLEYFELALYTRGLATVYPTAFLPDEHQVLTQIAKHDAAHVAVLRAALGGSAPTQPDVSTYDFTGGGGNQCGPFRAALGAPATTAPDGSAVTATDPDQLEFLKLAMIVKDLGVRAYKGSLATLMGTPHLSSMFRMHSVKARHSAALRRLRAAWTDGFTYVGSSASASWYWCEPWIARSQIDGQTFDYNMTTSVVYAGGLSQRDIIDGTTTSAIVDGESVQTVVMRGVYGPLGQQYVIPTTPSSSEDNAFQSSSIAANVLMPLDDFGGRSDRIFDEPLSAEAVSSLAALFGIV